MKLFLLLFSPLHLVGLFTLHFGGGGGSSKSSSDTFNTDKRIAVDSGAGISGDNSSITINSNDGAIVARALDSVDKGSAIQGEGFSKLLQTSLDIFKTGTGLIGQTQASIKDAYSSATADKSGALDNRTIVILSVVAAVVVGLFAFNKKWA